MMIQTHARAYIHEGRRPAQLCEAKGCSNSTREHKPFCSNHVDRHPYVQKLLEPVDGHSPKGRCETRARDGRTSDSGGSQGSGLRAGPSEDRCNG